VYGRIGSMRATPGGRDALVGILLEATGAMPGCLSYVVALDPRSEDRIWVTEVWTDRESHAASPGLPVVRTAIARGRPLIAEFGDATETVPVGGHGLRAGEAG
jgi:quinol monooxygenase YgiN